MNAFLKHLQAKLSVFFEHDRAKVLKGRQKGLFFTILSIGGVAIVVLLFKDTLFLKKEIVIFRKEKTPKIETAKESVDTKKVWVERLESEMDLLKKKNEELEKLVTLMSQKMMAQDQVASQNSSTIPQTVKQQNQEGHQRAVLDQKPIDGSLHTLNTDHLNAIPYAQGQNDSQYKKLNTQTQAAQTNNHPTKITKISFNLQSVGSKKINKSIDHYVPSGTFVRGRLTSGVVASTAVSASSDPQPIHMELTDLGNLPRNFKTDLKKCFLIGSAYGDLPSERVYMRLETLSCVERKTEEVIEIKVDGYVSGEDGANGMRGRVVDRSGPAMRNAFMGGFISGMGQFINGSQGGITQISPTGVTSQQALSAIEMVKGGAGKGVGNAFEKLSDFYIKRAEQLQPVIEIEPGRQIDVVFKGGFDMNQTLYRQSLKNHHDRSRHSDLSKQFD